MKHVSYALLLILACAYARLAATLSQPLLYFPIVVLALFYFLGYEFFE